MMVWSDMTGIWTVLALALALSACNADDSPVPPATAANALEARPAAVKKSASQTASPRPRSPVSMDFNGDGKADLLWSTDGGYPIWLMDDGAVRNASVVLGKEQLVVVAADFDGDGKADLLTRQSAAADYQIHLLDGRRVIAASTLRLYESEADRTFGFIRGVGDFNADGRVDVVASRTAEHRWSASKPPHHIARDLFSDLFILEGSKVLDRVRLFDNPDKDGPNLKVSRLADFNGDGKTDLLIEERALKDGRCCLLDSNGKIASMTLVFRLMDGAQTLSQTRYEVPGTTQIVGAADFNGDGKEDLALHDPMSGEFTLWLMDGGMRKEARVVLRDAENQYELLFTPDLDGDRKADLLWYSHKTRGTAAWLMDGVWVKATNELLRSDLYKVVATLDLDRDGRDDLIWRRDDIGRTVAWGMNGLEKRHATELATGLDSRVMVHRRGRTGSCDTPGFTRTYRSLCDYPW